MSKERRTAVIHDWLVIPGGAERVLSEILPSVPGANLYAIVDFLSTQQRQSLGLGQINTSFVQRLPLAKRYYWYYAPLMALAVEQFDLRKYDLVISSSYAFAKGVIVGPEQLHISYMHSPLRFVWDLQSYYFKRFDWGGFKRLVASISFHYLRRWDIRTANSPDLMICPSDFIRRRIYKAYRRPSVVVYPPIDTQRFSFQSRRENYYLTGSFMNPFKALDVIVEAFRDAPERYLIVFGSGPDYDRIKAKAGPNVHLVGRVSDDDLVRYMQSARAFLFAAPEDFGMIMAEAQSCGTPVIAYGVGGASEIIRDLSAPRPTGVFFSEHSTPAILEAIALFEANSLSITPENCRQNALRFGTSIFRANIRKVIETSWESWSSRQTVPDVQDLQAELFTTQNI
jgi:glycosyltransferase involved in cell wall biosynthesis